MANKFKVGDIIIFSKDIFTSYTGHYLLIPAHTPCKLLELTKDHIIVERLGYMDNKRFYKVRKIDDRMIKLKGLGKILYE